MKRKIFIVVLALGVAAQFAVLAWLLVSREITLRYGNAVLLQVAPVDPADPFRGRYVTLAFKDINSVVVAPDKEGWRKGETAWMVLETNANNVATIKSAVKARPHGELTIKARVSSQCPHYIPFNPPTTNRWGYTETHDSGQVMVRFADLPCSRYYLPERVAPEAEKAYFAAVAGRENDIPTYTKVRLWRGHVVVEDLLIRGVPLHEVLKAKSAAAKKQ